MSLVRALPLLLWLVASAAGAAAGPDRDEGNDLPRLFEALLEKGDEKGAERLLRDRRLEVVYLVDGYLEAGLSALEEGETERSRALFDLASSSARLGDEALGVDGLAAYAAAWRRWDEAERKRFRRGQGLYRDGREALRAHDLDRAAEAFAASRRIARELGDLWGEAQAEQALGDLAFGRDEVEEAVARHERARALFARLAHPREARSLHALGLLYEKSGDLERAKGAYERMLDLAEKSRERVDARPIHEALARIEAALGHADAARRHAAAAAGDDDGSG